MCLSGVFAFIIKTIYQKGVNFFFIGAFIIVYLFTPYHIAYSVTIWKDILFCCGVALVVTSIYRIIEGLGKQKTSWLIYVFGSISYCLLRSNGLFAYIIFFLLSLIVFLKDKPIIEKHFRKKFVILSCSVIFVAYILQYPVLSKMNIEQPDRIEVFSILEQQIVSVAIDGNMSEEEREELGQFIDLDRAKEEFLPYISDPIKSNIRQTHGLYFEENTWKFLDLWRRIGIRNIPVYIKAWVEMTKGYWNSGYKYWILRTNVHDNDLGIYRNTRAKGLRQVIFTWFDLFEENLFFEPMRSIGLQVWIVLLACGTSIINKRKKILVVSFPLLSIIFTLLIATPVFCEFRYAYYVFISMPIVFASFFGRIYQQNDIVN